MNTSSFSSDSRWSFFRVRRTAMRRSTIHVLLLLLVLCSACRIVPVQKARVSQIETYRQDYYLCTTHDAKTTIAAVLGSSNTRPVSKKLPDAWETYLYQAQHDGFVVLGQILMTVSVYPLDNRLIFFEGQGRHILFNSRTREMIASSEFTIVDDGPRWLDELKTGSVTVRVLERTSREFVKNLSRYVRETEIFVRIYVEELSPGVFTIDYDAAHDIGIEDLDRDKVLSSFEESGNTVVALKREGGGQFRAIRRIGSLRFDHRDDERKLLDLREYRDTLRTNYPELLKQDPHPPSPTELTFAWAALPRCAPRPQEDHKR